MAAALVLAVGVALSFLSGRAFIPSEVLTDQSLSLDHLKTAVPGSVIPDELVGIGLRHAIPVALEEAVVTGVKDGDTIFVRIGEAECAVRLIGINAPENADSEGEGGTWEGAVAAGHMRSIVSEGMKVYLQKDTSETYRDGSLLRYVWLVEPSDFVDKEEVAATMLNARMLAEGYAKAHKFKPDDAYFEIFKTLQLEAFHAERGLWESGIGWSNNA